MGQLDTYYIYAKEDKQVIDRKKYTLKLISTKYNE